MLPAAPPCGQTRHAACPPPPMSFWPLVSGALWAETKADGPFYKCFISYTEADDAFSRKLYDDLQAAQVRCWRWREDAKWGNEIIREVDDAIRIYDKLVVILSAASLAAPAVLDEIERALEREARENRNVLFPVRVDDAVFSWQHPRQANLTRKVIGDFTRWTEPAAYRPRSGDWLKA